MDKLKKLQATCTDILFHFDEICKKHGLTYYLAFGTLLGAVRHNGFIPWDDDIDLFMPKEDLDKLLAIADDVFEYPYRINHYTSEYFESYSYNFRIGTQKAQMQRMVGGRPKPIDVFISVFPVFDAPESKALQKLLNFRVTAVYSWLRFVRSSQNGYGDVHNRSRWEILGILINKMLPFMSHGDCRKIARRINSVLSSYMGCKSNYSAVFTYGTNKLIYQKEWFGTPVYKEFEGRMLPCPSNSDAILKFCYNDYMQLPPEEKQKPQHSVDVIFNS